MVDQETLKITHHVWFTMFNNVVHPIISHVSSLMKTHGSFDYLILVGGMTESHYVRMKIEKEFSLDNETSLVSLFIPIRPILAVVRGAVLLAKNPNYIYSRRMRKTYGTVVGRRIDLCRERGISEEFIEKNKFFSKNSNIHYVGGIITRLLKKGDVVRVNEVSWAVLFELF